MGGTGRGVIALAASVLLCGCFVAYHPTRPHQTASDGVTARIVSLDTIANVAEMNVAVGASAQPPVRAANAWLTTPAARPCSGGATPSSESPGALRADERVLSFDLRAPAAAGLLGALPTVLDLDLVPGDPAAARRCLRVSVSDPASGVEWEAWPRWFVATGLRVVGAPPASDPIHGGVLFSFGGGVWVGPVRLRLDWLVGEAGTDRPPPTGYGDARAQLIGGDAAAEIFPIHVGWLGVGVQAGYEYLATDFHAQQGSNESDSYDGHGPRGPRVALRIARLPAPRGWPAFRARPDHWSIGVDLFAARWTGLPGLAPMRYGIAIGGEWGRWW
jgi:hypothetical protein